VKVVYGSPKTILTMGMAMLGDTPTPFFGFVDKSDVEGDEFFVSGPNSTSLIEKIDALGGVIIYVENPDIAGRLHGMLSLLFETACGGPWGEIEQAEAGLQ